MRYLFLNSVNIWWRYKTHLTTVRQSSQLMDLNNLRDKSLSSISRVNSISVKSKVRLENLFWVLFQNFFTNSGKTLSKLTHNVIRKRAGEKQEEKIHIIWVLRGLLNGRRRLRLRCDPLWAWNQKILLLMFKELPSAIHS